MSWDSVIGQNRAKTIIRAAIASGRVPSAWLFTGIEGIGKDAAAIQAAKALRCQSPGPRAEPCEVCHNCTLTRGLQDTNVRFVFALPTGKGEDGRNDAPMLKLSDTEISLIREQLELKAADPYHNITIPRAQQIKISSIREVKRDVSYAAGTAGWRVIIISEAHVMGEEAANAFLKTLEEPAHGILLILTSSQPERILPTIRSRCQEVRFDPLNDEQIAAALAERKGIDPHQATLTAKLCGGSYSRAVELSLGDLNQLRFDVVTFLRAALKRSPVAMHTEVERLIANTDRTRLEQILAMLQLWLRDALALQLGCGPQAVINYDQTADLQRFCANFPKADIRKMIDHVEDSIRCIRSNVQVTLAFIVLAMRLENECYH